MGDLPGPRSEASTGLRSTGLRSTGTDSGPKVADRVAGLITGLAYGDALGARYEGFGWPRRPASIRFGRGLLAWRSPGWWTDDTDMSLAVLLALARTNGVDWPDGVRLPAVDHLQPARLDDEAGLRLITSLWLIWRSRAAVIDMGVGTVRALNRIGRLTDLHPDAVTAVAERLAGHGGGGGNGAVMRTAPVALGHLGDPAGAYRAAVAISALTHAHPRACEAAGIWTVLCERALVTGRLAVEPALECVRHDPFWGDRLLAPSRPGHNGPKGWAPATLTDAWWCVTRTRPEGAGIDDVTRAAVAAGGDTDTTAAVAGALAGSLAGAAGLPADGYRLVHGGAWTGRRWTLRDLADFARRCAA